MEATVRAVQEGETVSRAARDHGVPKTEVIMYIINASLIPPTIITNALTAPACHGLYSAPLFSVWIIAFYRIKEIRSHQWQSHSWY